VLGYVEQQTKNQTCNQKENISQQDLNCPSLLLQTLVMKLACSNKEYRSLAAPISNSPTLSVKLIFIFPSRNKQLALKSIDY